MIRANVIKQYFPNGLATPWRGSLPWEYLITGALVRSVFPDIAVLKTDCHDEHARKPCDGGLAYALGPNVSLLELDHVVVDSMKARGEPFDIWLGSILAIPWSDGSFALVADFSTMDHVAPQFAPRALSEYYRVLLPGGYLLLFVWESCDAEDIEKSFKDGEGEYGPNHQFYFNVGNGDQPSDIEEWAHRAGFDEPLSKSWFVAPGAMRQMTRYIFAK